jgi:hypothetical protein
MPNPVRIFNTQPGGPAKSVDASVKPDESGPEAPKSKVPTYRHAQKEAMKTGDTNTYFMYRTSPSWDAPKPGRKDR